MCPHISHGQIEKTRKIIRTGSIKNLKTPTIKKIERSLSEDELSRLNKALKDAELKEMPLAILAIKLLILTGARVTEILTLKWEHVDLERGVLNLPDSKTGAKTIVLAGSAIELLSNAHYLEGNPYVCFGEKPGGRLVGLKKSGKGYERMLASMTSAFTTVDTASPPLLPPPIWDYQLLVPF